MKESWIERLELRPAAESDTALFLDWARRPHVRDTWFKQGYAPPDSIYEWVAGNGYDYPLIILLDTEPIGFMLYCDLAAFALAHPEQSMPFHRHHPGTYCIDLFIANEGLLGRGIGSVALKTLIHKLHEELAATWILIDPAVSNQAAIRCYERLGFQTVREQHDGVTQIQVMELLLAADSEKP